MDMSIQASGSSNESFPGNCFRSRTDNDINIRLYVRIPGFSYSYNSTRFNSNTALDDALMIED